MLVPIQTSGAKPPLFFVHGLHGVMPVGTSLARGLGPDQPLYVIHAEGMDGRSSLICSVSDMVATYVDQIEEERPAGPIVVGGMCDGSLTAIEVARTLQESGREIGPVILADPPVVPRASRKQAAARVAPPTVGGRALVRGHGEATAPNLGEEEGGPTILRNEGPVLWRDDPITKFRDVRPEVQSQMYNQVHKQLLIYASRLYNDMPFDPTDPQQLRRAAWAGVGAAVAFSRHVPSSYAGPAQLILSEGRTFGFFHPDMHWHKLLTGPRMIHVLPWDHKELFTSGRESLARAIKFMLDDARTLENLTDAQANASTIEQLAPRIGPLVASHGR